jgi:hypothetical protein
MKRLVAVVPLVALLAGCGLGASLDRMDREAYQRTCDGFGIPRGTEAYSNCMVQQAAQRAESNERARDREALEKLRRSR